MYYTIQTRLICSVMISSYPNTCKIKIDSLLCDGRLHTKFKLCQRFLRYESSKKSLIFSNVFFAQLQKLS